MNELDKQFQRALAATGVGSKKRLVLKWKRQDAGWYRSTDGYWEIESVERMGGGGEPGEWQLHFLHEPNTADRMWIDTVASYRDAKETAQEESDKYHANPKLLRESIEVAQEHMGAIGHDY